MREKEMLAVVKALAHQPTAPFHEDAVRTEIEAQLRKIPHVKFERDGFGNIIAHYQRGRRRAPAWGLAAHMDHPGWVRDSDGELRFLGSVAARFRSNPKKRSFGDFEMWDLSPFEIRDRQIHPALVTICSAARKLSVCFASWRKKLQTRIALAFSHGGGSRFCRGDQAARRESCRSLTILFARNEHAARHGGNWAWSYRPGGRQDFEL